MMRMFVGVMLAFAATILWGENVDLHRELDRQRAAQLVKVTPPPSDTQCAAWLFNTDLAHAKARICASKEKSPGSK